MNQIEIKRVGVIVLLIIGWLILIFGFKELLLNLDLVRPDGVPKETSFTVDGDRYFYSFSRAEYREEIHLPIMLSVGMFTYTLILIATVLTTIFLLINGIVEYVKRGIIHETRR